MRQTPTLTALVGLPGAGKSTWAQAYALEHLGVVQIVSRDSIRMTMFGVTHDPRIESTVTHLQDTLILDALRAGRNVVVDNLNLRKQYRNALVHLAAQGGAHYEEKFFPTPIQTCITRNAMRSDTRVPDAAMEKFINLAMPWYKGAIVPTQIPFQEREVPKCQEYDPALFDTVICDLDGTLCDLNGRDPYDPSTCADDLPVAPVLDCLYAMNMALDGEILFVSGREERYRPETLAFLQKHTPFPFKLFMRPTGDKRKDTEVKREIYERHIRGQYNVSFVLDDRPSVVRMWRYDLGLMVFQVNDKEF